MNAVKVSIIVPIYNAENFLKECISSVLNQTFKDWELLLIDDGSCDNSAAICERYVQLDNRINFYHKSNTGVSDTRNFALDIIKGKYVIFLDSDDFWCSDDILKDLVNLSETNNLDIVRAEYKEVTYEGKDLRKPNCDYKTKFQKKILFSNDFLNLIVQSEYFLVLSLIRTEKILDIRFNTNRIFLEDAEFYLRLLQKQLRCMYVPIIFYAYRKHKFAVTQKIIPNNKKLRDGFNFSRLCLDLSLNTQDVVMKNLLLRRSIENYLFDLRVIAESQKTFQEHSYWFSLWKINDLDCNIKRISKENNLICIYKILLFPLSTKLLYFRYMYKIKVYIKKFYKNVFLR